MKSFAITAAFAASAAAHMIMSSPQPYSPAPDNSPLVAGGSNFPCKKSGPFTATQQAKATVGGSVKLSFSGTAVHNGGSCQISLSKDTGDKLSASSQFKVIYSILGACPGLSGQATSYDVPIPSDVPAGDYTWAWTWFNNVGNREMYMNCAPMTISGGSGSDGSFTALPDMAVYNIASQNNCKTLENFDVDFPNPGKYVSKAASFKPAPPTCDGKAQAGGSGATGAASGSSLSAGSGSGSQGGAATPSATQSFDDGQYHPNKGNGAAAAASQAPAAASTPAVVPSAPTPASSPQVQAPGAAGAAAPSGGYIGKQPASANGTYSSPSSGAPATGSVSGSSCSPDGAMVCSADGTQFALCNWGKTVFQPVAAGTKCSNGSIMRKRSVKAVRGVLWNA